MLNPAKIRKIIVNKIISLHSQFSKVTLNQLKRNQTGKSNKVKIQVFKYHYKNKIA